MSAGRTALLALVGASLLLSGCGRDMRDLEQWLEEMKQRPAAPIAPLPQIQPYETFTYTAHDLRSPFTPDVSARRQAIVGDGEGIQPDASRHREYLEEFPLDTLRMVGTLTMNDEAYGLIRTTDGVVHRVKVGDYLGQNHGRITAIADTSIGLVEIIPDGMGGWTERRAAVALSE